MSVDRIESDLEVSRRRLANTVDELVYRGHPKNVAQRFASDTRAKAVAATTTSDGSVRPEILAAVAAVGALLIVSGLLRRRSR